VTRRFGFRLATEGSWRDFLDFPLVALAIAVALFIGASEIGQALASLISLPTQAGQTWLTNALVLGVILTTYKVAIVRLGAFPRDDLTYSGAVVNVGAGILIGFLLMAASVGIAAISHVYHLLGEGDSSELIHELVTTGVMTAFTEEIVFRGILFRWLEELGGTWVALIMSSALFGMAHVFNANATWFASLAVAIEGGFLLGGAYMLTRNLWLPIGIHAAWNVTQGEVFGVPVSGGPVHGLVRARLAGPPLLSGGGFGLEASLIALVIAAAVGACFVWLAIRRGEIVRPAWVRGSEPADELGQS